MTVAWVIGARGMLGSALVRELARRRDWELLDAEPVPWGSSTATLTEIAAATTARLLDRAAERSDSWAVLWAAGAAVTSSSEQALASELEQLGAVLDGISAHASSAPTKGAIFYASSAGGVYAGSARPPFSELTVPEPISPYGRHKLQAEKLVADAAERSGASSLIGRIANLYGPGQRLDKLQGIISHIALARLTSRPASIYVSLDTLRDYILVDDCAALVLDGAERVLATGESVTKVLCSGQATTIAALLGQFKALSGGKPKVVLGTSASGALQARDLRLRSVVWPDLDRRRAANLPAGIHATMMDVLAGIQSGQSNKADR